MDLLNVYTRVGILFRTWYRRIAMYIHAAYKLKTTNLQLQDASYTNKQKNSVLWKSNEDMNLDQYLKTPAGQNQLKQAKIQFAEMLIQELSLKYLDLKNPENTAQKMLLSLALQETILELQKEEEKDVPN